MASELNVGGVVTTGYVEPGTGIKLSSTNGPAFSAVKYSASGTSWTDVLTIAWNNVYWSTCSLVMNITSDSIGGALELCVMIGHSSHSSGGSISTQARLGTDLSAYYQWVLTAGSPPTSKLQIKGNGSTSPLTFLIQANLVNRTSSSSNTLTWH